MASLGAMDPAELAVEVRHDASGAPLVVVAGELDISNIAMLEQALDPVLAGAPELLVFDLGDLRFMDSSGIALLLTAAGRCGAVEVREPSQILRRIIESMGLGEILRMTP